ncbi:hypothetical protein N9B72_00175 [Bacteriovoracaceae bacterium]|nr:hypothetical protein [Bacteriovoracaceae bacterium]
MITFFKINRNDLMLGKVYSFPIYSFFRNPKTRQIVFYPNEKISSLDSVVKTDLAEILQEFQIYFKDIKRYLKESETDYKTFSLLNKSKFDYIMLCESRKSRRSSKALLEMLAATVDIKEKNNKFFKKFRLNIVREVINYEINESETINTIICLIEKVFTRDFKSVKIAAVSFVIAKEMGISDKKELANIILLSLYKNIGRMIDPVKDEVTSTTNFVKNNQRVIENTIIFFKKYEDPVFDYLVAELKNLKDKINNLYTKKIEIILVAEILCLSLDLDTLPLNKIDDLLKNNDLKLEYKDEIKKALESI